MQNDNDIDRLTDLRILQTIVTAIEENQAPQPLVKAASDFIHLLTLCESDEYNGELWSYFTAHPRLARVSMLPTVQRIINCALEEVKRIPQLSSGRPLTDEERHILRDVLLPLMQKVYAFNNWRPVRARKRVAQVLNLGGFAARGRWESKKFDLVKTSWTSPHRFKNRCYPLRARGRP